jgi:hypothetical protein
MEPAATKRLIRGLVDKGVLQLTLPGGPLSDSGLSTPAEVGALVAPGPREVARIAENPAPRGPKDRVAPDRVAPDRVAPDRVAGADASVSCDDEVPWDAAALALNPPEVATQSIPLELVSAEVADHGFSAALPRNSTQPQRYDYHNVRRDAKWPPLAGGLTRFGNVTDMLRQWDDEMVVMAGGDEIRLRFRVPDQPIPEGWQRDFILHSVGWDKDADLNTLAGQSSDPLPFRDMRSYPPPRDDQQRAKEIEQLNQWHRTRLQPFRKFWQR